MEASRDIRRKLRFTPSFDRWVRSQEVRHASTRSVVVHRCMERYQSCVSEGFRKLHERFDVDEIEGLCGAFDETDLHLILDYTGKDSIPSFLKHLEARAHENRVVLIPKVISLIEERVDTAEFLSLLDIIVENINKNISYFSETHLSFFVIALSGNIELSLYDRFYDRGPKYFSDVLKNNARKMQINFRAEPMGRIAALSKDDKRYKEMLDEVRRQLFRNDVIEARAGG